MQNFYAAELSVFGGGSSDPPAAWTPLLLNQPLMPNCHCEDRGQADIVLTFHTHAARHLLPPQPTGAQSDSLQLQLPWVPEQLAQPLARLRLVLLQPSTAWNQVGLRDLACFRAANTEAPPTSKRQSDATSATDAALGLELAALEHLVDLALARATPAQWKATPHAASLES